VVREPQSGHGPQGQKAAGHRLTIENREQATVTGVVHVASFDDRQIVLDTEMGALTLLGQDLRIKQLDVDAGTFWVEGLLTSAQYAAGRQGRGASEGLLSRLFR
jgi:sporulation protein YabP